MTREEAHRILSNGLNNAPSEHEWCEAFNMAIKALLEQKPIQEKQAESEKYQKAFDDGYMNGYTQAKFDYVLNEIIQESKHEPCEDAISRVETVKFLANHSREFEDAKVRMAFMAASSLVNNPHNLPPIQPKTGHWINIDDVESECSECGHREPNERFIFEDINFCAKCGAKMESEE